MDIFEAIQLRAAVAVLTPDREAWVRYVCRWYSKEFSTPLNQVHDLPLEFVLVNYFEAAVEEMTDEQRYEYLTELVMTAEERKQVRGDEAKAADADDAFVDKLTEAATSQAGPPKERKRGFVKKAIQDQAAKEHGRAPVVDAAEPEGFAVDFGGNLLKEVGDLDPLGPSPQKKVI